MICDPAQVAAWKAALIDADAAYHNLMTGRMARVIVDQNGERVEFSSANKSDLYLYIADLRSKIAACEDPVAVAMNSGPARFWF